MLSEQDMAMQIYQLIMHWLDMGVTVEQIETVMDTVNTLVRAAAEYSRRDEGDGKRQP